eukprot:Seg5193.1 transcript_id=Seg5193.1/GoldUCD/mRNA.D3Y31 product="hypothetical protein" protein_id=Seg5193.1/GoldUCD/D3Y31
MKGIIGIAIILLVQVCTIMSSAILGSNEITDNVGTEKSWLGLQAETTKLLLNVSNTGREFRKERNVKRFYVSANKCGQDFNTAIKLLQDHVCETQGLQIRESRATKSANQKGTKSYVQKFMDFEFALRNLLSRMRQIAKTDKLKQIPPYSVGLGKLTSNSVEVKESSIDDSNFIIHKELRELQECLKTTLKLLTA